MDQMRGTDAALPPGNANGQETFCITAAKDDQEPKWQIKMRRYGSLTSNHKQYINDSADKPQICINTALNMNAEH